MSQTPQNTSAGLKVINTTAAFFKLACQKGAEVASEGEHIPRKDPQTQFFADALKGATPSQDIK